MRAAYPSQNALRARSSPTKTETKAETKAEIKASGQSRASAPGRDLSYKERNVTQTGTGSAHGE